ncbi:hypothetical protein Pst134EA_018914 [Puccinia striiformis f. sp. tritici]|uniref:hypothetical protein n=1 Tax=Puccinia striiformis f. sp. tritici TaxID=168172 RepID=UPI00200817C3|nr:hypothetical protein Pst134EA_018914 [Puccinia striiformis f. sp. tritici]KAH9458757.1 hypothetical protein Pst134EA_018914 [Puccinia striiformis f. sp. tritici]
MASQPLTRPSLTLSNGRVLRAERKSLPLSRCKDLFQFFSHLLITLPISSPGMKPNADRIPYMALLINLGNRGHLLNPNCRIPARPFAVFANKHHAEFLPAQNNEISP